MEMREILLKTDRIVLALERLDGGKIRATATSWDDQGHLAQSGGGGGKQVALVRVDKPIAYLDIDAATN